MDTDLTTTAPPVIDAELARLHGETEAARNAIHGAIESLHRYAGHKPYYFTRGRKTYAESAAETEAWARANLDTIAPYAQRNLENALTTLDKARATTAATAAAMVPLDAEHERRRWSRFFLVPGGHIHASTSCHTLRWNTQVGWLPSLSGLTEADAVAAHGTILCTHCFPSAPVEWTTGVTAPVDPATCPGSGGQPKDGTVRRMAYSTYGACPECGDTVQYGQKIRKHKTPKAK